MISALDRWALRVSIGLAIVGGLGLAVAVLVTCASALGKLGFRINKSLFGAADIPAVLAWVKPIRGEDELVSFAVGFALFAALPYVMIMRGHVSVDLLKSWFSPRANRLLVLLGDVLLTVAAWMIFAQQWNLLFKKARRNKDPLLDVVIAGDWLEVGNRFLMRDETQILGLEKWPMYIWAEVCLFLFVCVGMVCVLRSARDVIRPTKNVNFAR